jgi:hypothetical protein
MDSILIPISVLFESVLYEGQYVLVYWTRTCVLSHLPIHECPGARRTPISPPFQPAVLVNAIGS